MDAIAIAIAMTGWFRLIRMGFRPAPWRSPARPGPGGAPFFFQQIVRELRELQGAAQVVVCNGQTRLQLLNQLIFGIQIHHRLISNAGSLGSIL